MNRKSWADKLLDTFVAVIWLTVALAQGRAGDILGYGLMMESALIAWLFMRRRPALHTGNHAQLYFAAFATILPMFALRPTHAGWLEAGLITEWVALSWLIAALWALGNSFGMAPAYRGVICSRGLYRLVRHPLYVGSILFVLGYVVGHPSFNNFAVLALLTICQWVRAMLEEKWLSNVPEYQAYRKQVRGRFIPR